MARVKNGLTSRKRRKRVLKQAKGYFGAKRTLYRTAKQQVIKSGQYAYRDRRQTKREFRKLWIARINAAARQNGMSYSRLMNGLKTAGIDINRKMLSEIAISDEKAFAEIVSQAKKCSGKISMNQKGATHRGVAPFLDMSGEFLEQRLGEFKITFLLLLVLIVRLLFRDDIQPDQFFPFIKEREGLIGIFIGKSVIEAHCLVVFISAALHQHFLTGFFHF